MYTHADDKLRQEERCGTIAGNGSPRREATRHLRLHLSIAWRAGSDIRGRSHVCARIKQTFICKRLLFWPGFQKGYRGLRSLSSASPFTVCKSSIWICEQRLSLFCYFCSSVQKLFFSSFCRLVHWFEQKRLTLMAKQWNRNAWTHKMKRVSSAKKWRIHSSS